MKILVLLCLLPLISGSDNESGDMVEDDISIGDVKLTLVSDGRASKDQFPVKIPSFEQLITHDCSTIRKFPDPDMPEWIGINRGLKDGKTDLSKFTKYNWAYGIPIFGIPTFTDDAMKRACYLVRFLFAGNEQFRLAAYKSRLHIRGQKGGFIKGDAPNAGNAGLMCPCGKENPGRNPDIPESLLPNKVNMFPLFPFLDIYSTAHEMAHFYLTRLGKPMLENNGLILPEFINSADWSWRQPYDQKELYEISKKGKQCNGASGSKSQGKLYDFIWNSLQVDRLKKNTVVICGTDHYFIYTGQDKFLGLSTGAGQRKNEARQKLKDNHRNLYNLMMNIWPCNNEYISVCEDSAHGMTKGAAQKLTIGRSVEGKPYKMECLKDVDTPEVAMKDLSPLPTDDVSLDENRAWNKAKCLRATQDGGFLTRQQSFDDLATGEVAKLLGESNEHAWWLRKCCAKSAKFF